jgi:hypothetical protein
MSSDPSSLESDLRRLRAAALDESLLARLDACAADHWSELTPAETVIERHLQGIAPAALPASLMASLESSLAAITFPGEANIVRFPKHQSAAPTRNRNWWGAAAAVALIGAATALFIPQQGAPGAPSTARQESRGTAPATTTPELIPAGFKRGLSEARDEGVIWQSNNRPHRVLKFVYQDQVTLKDRSGRTYQMQQPRVEYILVPAKND